jgi:predicted transcriptional regulator of viral defense system
MRRAKAKVRLGAIAGRQFGRVSAAQIAGLGVDRRVVADWKRQGYIHLVLPRVYGVGHTAPSYEADLAAALLYAGPGAALSHGTAAHWLGLLDASPRFVHVSTPRKCRSQPGIVVHARRDHDRIWHRGLPTTTLPQTLLDLAATQNLRTVRKALANADYQKRLDVTAVEAALGRGRPGSARLREALAEHQPRLARTKSDLEVAFLELCEAAGIPLPETNEWVAGWEVDALFREQRIAVELDGHGNHRSPAQVKRDRRKDLALRTAGLLPIRYSDEQLERRTDVIAEMRRLMAQRPGTAQNSSVWPNPTSAPAAAVPLDRASSATAAATAAATSRLNTEGMM